VAKTNKSLSVVDVLDNGNIYLEAGYYGNKITQLGKLKQKFSPHVFVNDSTYKIVCPYLISKDDVPSSFEKVDKFKDSLRLQVDSNQYIKKWCQLGAEELLKWIRTKTNADIQFILLDNSSNLSTLFYTYLNKNKQVFQLPTKSVEEIDTLTVDDGMPDDIKNKYNSILAQLNREDRDYSVSDLNLFDDELKYFNGFVDFSSFEEESLKNKYVILVTDFADVSHTISEATRNLESRNINVIFTFVLSKLIP
jgi:hypothetical protein